MFLRHHRHRHDDTEVSSDTNEKVEPVLDEADVFDDVSSEDSCQMELRFELWRTAFQFVNSFFIVVIKIAILKS